mgnify:FL=1
MVACVLTAEAPFEASHDVTFSIVQLDGEPTTVHEERAVVPIGSMGAFEVVLRRPVRHWEVRIDADPEVAFITVYHLLDGRVEPSMTYRSSDLYYSDYFDGGDTGNDTILPPWLLFDDDGSGRPAWQ